jgi:outer membrane protein
MNESMSATFFLTPRKVFAAMLTLLLAASAAQGEVTNQVKSLTLRECIERALENNLEIKAQRINPTIGTWGVVGAQGTVYDPILKGSIMNQGTTTWLSASGAASLGMTNVAVTTRQKDSGFSADLSGKLPTGASYDFFGSDTHSWGNEFVSRSSGDAGVSLTQPLLKNFGFGVNAATIRIARENKTIAVQDFVQFVMSKISAVSAAYYELVFAIENHKTAVENRDRKSVV